MLLLVVGCARAGEPPRQSPSPGYENQAPAYKGTIVDLCAAVEESETDRERAETTFRDKVHDPLHDIARDAEKEDRAAAAALLQAKNRVEEDVQSAGGDLTADLASLLEASRKALEALDLDPPGCPQPAGEPSPTSPEGGSGY